jgi:hypothetical protein
MKIASVTGIGNGNYAHVMYAGSIMKKRPYIGLKKFGRAEILLR